MMDATISLDDSGNSEEPVAIAIVGIALEFPQGVTTAEEFWKMICDGRSSTTEFPASRMNVDAFFHPDEYRPSSIPLRGGNFVTEDLAAFDAPFFSITPAEASCMDPQHRRMLETAYLALEDAGIPIEECAGSDTSVYTGCFTNDYLSILQQDYDAEQRHAAMGIAPSMLANRLSWFFNFKGNSVNLDSACSSSLVALHLACQDLRNGNASMESISRANFVYHPNFMKMMSDFNFLSPDSRCWSFDQRANGYARGEGTAVIVVKRLEDALKSGDTIRAVIQNTGVNQDGRTPGITQPNQDAQVRLIRETYARCNIDMGPTRFFEAHGTGTKMGDPIEANSIGAAFRNYRNPQDPLYIGAVKANIGHLEGCSGLAGIIKAVLVLENGIIPPISGFSKLNPLIDAEGLHLKFPKELTKWPASHLRRACVNSFGFGGTNAVAILDDAGHYLQEHGLEGHHRTKTHEGSGLKSMGEEISKKIIQPIEQDPILLIWSTSEPKATERLSEAYKLYLNQDGSRAKSLAYTLTNRRSLLPWRSFAVVGEYGEGKGLSFNPTKSTRATENVQVAFVFTGQGSQYLGMGKELLKYPIFNQSINDSDACLKQLGCTSSLLGAIEGVSQIAIDDPIYSQPLITCLQIGLVDLYRDFGITPLVVIGHSSGEIAGAYTSGALSRLSAVKVAYLRGLLSSQLANEISDTTMMAASISEAGVYPYLQRLKKSKGSIDVDVGCVNSIKSITLTGNIGQLELLGEWLRADSVFVRLLRVPVAYHSRFMGRIADAYMSAISELEPGNPSTSVTMISSVTGEIISAKDLASSTYWAQNLTSPVQFDSALSKITNTAPSSQRKQLGKRKSHSFGITHLLEIGPHSALRGPIRENLEQHRRTDSTIYIPSLVRQKNAIVASLTVAGILHCTGYPIRVSAVNRQNLSSQQIPSNLPPYPFNHDRLYWNESRISKNFRFRESRRNDLLGTRSLDWNPYIAQWHNSLRINELPWLEDHRINGEIVLPAAGMVVMAVEALKELQDHITDLHGVEIRDLNLIHPISFSREVERVETQFTLSTERIIAEDPQWSTFRLFAIEGNAYTECCNGLIRPILSKAENYGASRAISFLKDVLPEDWMEHLSTVCQMSEPKPYSILSGNAVQYGPSFQSLERVWLGRNGEASGCIDTESWKNQLGSSLPWTYSTLHPSTLDGLAQLIPMALSQQHGNIPTMVPVRVATIWINCNSADLHERQILAGAICKLRGYRGASANILGCNPKSKTPFVYMEGLETTFIEGNIPDAQKNSPSRQLCMQLVWKPDIDMMSLDSLVNYCTRKRPSDPANTIGNHRLLTLAILCHIEEALEFVEKCPDLQPEKHINAYISWMRYQHERLIQGVLPFSHEKIRTLLRDPNSLKSIFSETEASGIDGFLVMHLGRNLKGILLGEVDPLALMFGDGLVDRYYEHMLSNDYHSYPSSRYIELSCFKNPSMNILEVGAGTGGQTLRLLECMSTTGVKRWRKYDYTDISPGFFPQAKEKFREFLSHMEFRVCDISKDPIPQSFEGHSYDLIVASHVLHATNNIELSLQNIHKLLKPNGKLLLFETILPEVIPIGFIFGLLKGWWSPLEHEERSRLSPCLTSQAWHRRLINSGFSGVDIEFPGQEHVECRYSSIMVSTAVEKTTRCRALDTTYEVYLVFDCAQAVQTSLTLELEAKVRTLGRTPIICTLDELCNMKTSSTSTLVFLLEVEDVFLHGISSTDYGHFHRVMCHTKSVIWVTKPKSQAQMPHQHLAEGVGRTLMSEDAKFKFFTLSLDDTSLSDETTNAITRLVQDISEQPVDNLESTYVLSRGLMHTCRIRGYGTMDTLVSNTLLSHREVPIEIESGPPLCLHARTPGNLKSLEWIEDTNRNFGSSLEEDEIVVDVKAIGLTWRDLLIASGRLNEVHFGTECAGLVIAAGTKSGFKIGSLVSILKVSTARSRIRVNVRNVVSMPSEMTPTLAASLPGALWTAYHSLVNIARVGKSDQILIYHGQSSFGQMAIQVARTLGATVFVTSDSADTFDFLTREIGIPGNSIFSTTDLNYQRNILLATNSIGVDVVIGALPNDLECLSPIIAPFSRIVDINMGQITGSKSKRLMSLGSNTSIASIDMVDMIERNPVLASEIFQKAMEFFLEHGLSATRHLRVFPASNSVEAFGSLLEEGNWGKSVLEFQPQMSITARILTKPKHLFSADGTYVIAGGLGGLGRSIARWMVEHGAQNLILLSRSGPKSGVAKSLIHELKAQGIRVATPLVDIGNFNHLRDVIDGLAKSMPAILGCIQATIALRDNLFPNMSHSDWAVSTASKVTGSWNLHKLLPHNLSFFVLLSSINGIFGGRAQANYAAGNTFKDALASYRRSLGQKAISIDLGLMIEEGRVAEDDYLMWQMKRIGHNMEIKTKEFLALLEHYCDPGLEVGSEDNAQILVGIELPDNVLKKGIELHHSIQRPMFRELFQMSLTAFNSEDGLGDTELNAVDRHALLRSETLDQATTLATQWFSSKLAQTLGLEEGGIDIHKPISALGTDSLVGIDLKNWVSKELGAEVEVFTLLGGSSIQDLCCEFMRKSRFRQVD
ncbi:putative polyketide synthase [Corynespora cassiicola Philippines]|uniref:Putative polyketide synthase n=1 Tax=Corynespora cassiicola Philippines TaxID=1448308 RepID=A0A2T2P3I0_CORCC|nr:putative polyketide synthase [Corynespora cassiicola Philippines]